MNGDKHYTLKEFYERYGSKYKWYEGQVAVNDWNDDGKIDDSDKQIYGCTNLRWTGSPLPMSISRFPLLYYVLYQERILVSKLLP